MALYPRADWPKITARALGYSSGALTLVDYAGMNIAVHRPLIFKLAKYANHAAYAAWIPHTLADPLEVWEHPYPTPYHPRRRYYMSAYISGSGNITHCVIAVVRNVVINSFRIESLKTANDYRYSPTQTPYIGY
jgi:hypothetical protein